MTQRTKSANFLDVAASVEHIRENANTVPLGDEEMKALDSIIAENPIAGERFHFHGMKHANV